MKVVNSYEEYLKTCNEVESTGEYYWMPKVSYELLTLEDLKCLLFSNYDLDSTLKLILTEVINNYGKEYSRGTLIGIEMTNEDYYYVYEHNGKKHYDTCVSSIF